MPQLSVYIDEDTLKKIGKHEPFKVSHIVTSEENGRPVTRKWIVGQGKLK